MTNCNPHSDMRTHVNLKPQPQQGWPTVLQSTWMIVKQKVRSRRHTSNRDKSVKVRPDPTRDYSCLNPPVKTTHYLKRLLKIVRDNTDVYTHWTTHTGNTHSFNTHTGNTGHSNFTDFHFYRMTLSLYIWQIRENWTMLTGPLNASVVVNWFSCL